MRYALIFPLAAALVASDGVSAPAAGPFGPGAIVARVRDAAGHALAGAFVEAVGAQTRVATTNGAGMAALVALPTGVYDVSVSLAGYTTFTSRVAIVSAGSTAVVAPALQTASFANLGSAAGVRTLPQLGADLDPFVAHALAADRAVSVTASPLGPAAAIDGTLPYESRVELDGIPLAGGADSPAAVRFRDAIGLAGIDVAAGPYLETPSLRDAVGGVINLRTPSLDGSAVAGADEGYDSAFGSFEHVRAVQRFGNLAFAADAVGGGGSDRSQSFKAAYAFGTGSAVNVAAYGLQGDGPVGDANVLVNAPAFSAGFHLALGGGTLEARSFASSLQLTRPLWLGAFPDAIVRTGGFAGEDARASGLQLGYDLPLGADRLQVTFDRRGDAAAIAGFAPFDQTFTTFGVRAGFALARAVRLELADAYAGGTLLPKRHDPQAELTYRPGARFTIHASAGSAYATAPNEVLAGRDGASPALPPETSFGYRVGADDALSGNDRVWLTAHAERRFQTFFADAASASGVPPADAANRGIDLGFERTATASGFGGLAYVAFDRTEGFGPAALPGRAGTAYALGPSEYAGEPASRFGLALTYRLNPACVEKVGATLLGSGNALDAHAVTLANISLCFPVFGAADVRIGEENAFGAVILNPVLAPLYYPHEFTFALGVAR